MDLEFYRSESNPNQRLAVRAGGHSIIELGSGDWQPIGATAEDLAAVEESIVENDGFYFYEIVSTDERKEIPSVAYPETPNNEERKESSGPRSPHIEDRERNVPSSRYIVSPYDGHSHSSS